MIIQNLFEDVTLKLAAYVLSGLVVVVLVFLRNRIIAFVNRMFAKVPVAGEWTTQIHRGGSWLNHESAVLRQFVHWVWGTTTVVTGEPRTTYSLHGHVSGHTLCLIYKQAGSRGSDSGGITLDVNPEGNEMTGYEVGYDQQTKTISPRKYRWTRK